jgi:hypothetical protein
VLLWFVVEFVEVPLDTASPVLAVVALRWLRHVALLGFPAARFPSVRTLQRELVW